MLAQEIIRTQRDGLPLTTAHIQHFVRGLVDHSWSEGQVAAMAMAVFLRGLDRDACVALTDAMMRSGRVLAWPDMPGPVLDKHSSGGVGDKVSLMLAPMVAACGGYVPMISGRGLGHTGGTCDKLEAIPGYCATPEAAHFDQVVRSVGCAIIGQTADLAPADRRLYAIRDVTATVESVPLITASILSKKLAAGLQGLVMDVTCGNGAFADTRSMADALAHSIVDVAHGAGLRTTALVTDMNHVRGRNVGNALEVAEAVTYLTGTLLPASFAGSTGSGDHGASPGSMNGARDPRLHEVTLALGAELLVLGGLAPNTAAARTRLQAALDSGAAAERFARMVAALGGPTDLLERPHAHLVAAPVVVPVPAPRAGVLGAVHTRAIGLAVVELGGGRRKPGAPIDWRVGLSGFAAPGQRLAAGEPIAWVHAADAASAARAVEQVLAACSVGDGEPQESQCVLGRIGVGDA
jgi:thymidine phosphorylase